MADDAADAEFMFTQHAETRCTLVLRQDGFSPSTLYPSLRAAAKAARVAGDGYIDKEITLHTEDGDETLYGTLKPVLIALA